MLVSLLYLGNIFSKEIILDNNVDDYVIGKSLLYLEDKDHTLTFDEISSKEFQGKFIKSEVNKPNFGYSSSCYWLKFSVKNTAPHINDWLITMDYAVLDYIDLYYQDQNKEWKVKKGGDRILSEQREYEQRYNIMSLDFYDSEPQTYYIRVETEGSYQLGIELIRQKKLFQKDIKSELSYGIYFGVLLIMVLYNFFLYFTVKDVNYLYYVLVIIANLMFFSSISGHSALYVWGSMTDWAGIYAVPFSMGFLALTTCLFAKKFLQIKKYSKVLLHLINGIALVAAFTMIGTFFISYSTASRLGAAVDGVTAIVVFIAGIVSLLKGNVSARYYVLAWSFYLIGAITLVLKTFGVFPPNFFTVHAVQIGSIMETMLLSFALGDKFNLLRKQKYDAQKQLLEVERNAKATLEMKVEERTAELKERNIEIQKKNTKIMDSIRYAKRIQEALLPEKQFFESLFPNSFVYYKPKDIVSGDFYWCEQIDEKIMFAVVDCTGHGVPGAFMSIVGYNGLNKAVKDCKGNITAGEILKNLNNNVLSTLSNQEQKYQIKDGMDMSLCVIDLKTKTLEFSGARNPLYLVRDEEMTQIKADKKSIGETEDYPFITHHVTLKENDVVYLFTDGYADQFGGDKKRKLNYPKFRELLTNASTMKIDSQKETLDSFLEGWQRDEGQVDDICVIGVSF